MGVGLKARQAGGLVVLPRKDFRPALGYRRCTGACTPHFLSNVFDIPYRDVSDRNASYECRKSFIVRHYCEMSSFGSPLPFSKGIRFSVSFLFLYYYYRVNFFDMGCEVSLHPV